MGAPVRLHSGGGVKQNTISADNNKKKKPNILRNVGLADTAFNFFQIPFFLLYRTIEEKN